MEPPDLSAARRYAESQGAEGEPLDLAYGIFAGVDLTEASLIDAVLLWTHLLGANLTEADLSRARAHNVDLARAQIRYAKFSFANLTAAQLGGVEAFGADLGTAHRTGAFLDDSTRLAGAKGLSGVTADYVRFNGERQPLSAVLA